MICASIVLLKTSVLMVSLVLVGCFDIANQTDRQLIKHFESVLPRISTDNIIIIEYYDNNMLLSILIVKMIAEVVMVVGSPTTTPQDITAAAPEDSKKDLVHITREEWKARPPKENTALKMPVPYVVIHHSFIPPVCVSRQECAYAVRTIQSMHMDDESRRWADIGYNFVVGGDGSVYDGRGWTTRGAHALHFNGVSIGICLIGNYNDTLPTSNMLETTKLLIEEGVRLGHLPRDYKIVGHRQVRPTECPGTALFEEIQTWPHYDPTDHKDNFYKKQQEINIVKT